MNLRRLFVFISLFYSGYVNADLIGCLPGNWAHFEEELMTRFGQSIGSKIHLSYLPVTQAIEGVQTGKCDFILGYSDKNILHLDGVLWSKPYLASPEAKIAVRNEQKSWIVPLNQFLDSWLNTPEYQRSLFLYQRTGRIGALVRPLQFQISQNKILEEKEEPSALVRFQVLILLRPGFRMEDLEKYIPKNIKMKERSKFVVLHSTAPFSEDFLSHLRTLREVEAVQRDSFLLEHPYNKDAPISQCKNESIAESLQDEVTSLYHSITDLACPLTEQCNNGRAKYWGIEAIDGHLMRKKVATLQLRSTAKTPVSILVFENGFDSAQTQQIQSVNGVSGASNEDGTEHGTGVIGVIAGKGGMGIADGVNISVKSPGGSMADFYPSLLEQCEEHHKKFPNDLLLINYSLGSIEEEAQLKPQAEEKMVDSTLTSLTQMGCLVFNASGNNSFKKPYRDLPPSMVRIGSSSFTSVEASFSDHAQLLAPGENVYTLGKTHSKPAPSYQLCSDEDTHPESPRQFQIGTSFSAPMVTGLAAQVVRVLNSGAPFAKLSLDQKLLLVRRILEASASDKQVNALRAVTLADQWNQHPTANFATPQLVTLLEKYPDPICKQVLPECQKQNNCGGLRECFEAKQVQFTLCPQLDSFSLALDLAETAIQQGYFEAGFRYLSQLKKSTHRSFRDSLTIKATEIYINHIKKREGSLKFERAADLGLVLHGLPSYFKAISQTKSCNLTEVEQIFSEILDSKKVREQLSLGIDLSRSEDRGSFSLMKQLKESFDEIKKIIGSKKYYEILYFSIQKTFEKGTSYFHLTRMIDHLYHHETHPEEKSLLQQVEGYLLSWMRTRNDELQKPKKTLFVASYDPYSQKDFLNSFFFRNKAALTLSIDQGRIHEMSPNELNFILDHIEEVPEWKPRAYSILTTTLQSLCQARGWETKIDQALVDRLIYTNSLYARFFKEDQKVVYELNQILSQCNHTQILIDLYKRYTQGEKGFLHLDTYVQVIRKLLAMSVLHENRDFYGGTKARGPIDYIQKLSEFNSATSKPGPISVPLYSPDTINRFNFFHYSGYIVDKDFQGDLELVDASLEKYLKQQVEREIFPYAAFDFFSRAEKNDWPLMKKRSELRWKNQLQAILANQAIMKIARNYVSTEELLKFEAWAK